MNAPIEIDNNLHQAVVQFKNEVRIVNKFNNQELEKIDLALEIGRKWHGTQKRETGDWYFIHPIRVAEKCLYYYQDHNLLIAALLHDTLEDSLEANYKEIQSNFGDQVAHLVKALTKLKKEPNTITVERILKLAIVDSRVLLIKLIDRLDNLNDIHLLARQRQRSNAKECILYATVAEGMGLPNLANDLRNSAFRVLHPKRYHKLSIEINKLSHTNTKFYNDIIKEFWTIVGIEHCSNIFFELKTPFDFADPKTYLINILNKIFILMDDKINCYTALGQIHSAFPVIPLRVHDYFACPLINGWGSLSTTVICQGLKVELLITTYSRHIKNQLGIFGLDQHNSFLIGSYQKFINSFASLFNNTDINIDEVFRSQYKLALNSIASRQFQVSSPKGEIVNLYEGASALDYAYAIHSEIGNGCIGAIINESFKVVPSYQLQAGNIVEILTDKQSKPTEDWLNWVIMPHSRKEILATLKKKK